ncbi:ABC transporter ATP-binding protein [Clostridium intestinale]|uniref:ABC transporter ATP-binding protein n=1 Tax=Clostridium intestinale TaxID=36845 RepID=UPI002DD675A3|nr:ABC transporter ATP-binding protein [Clostridium intestinale]WRY53986.1 ABC transporter ATP-binding protein [Clostridium intestinale]
MELATTKKPLMISSVILSALASIASFVPYIAIYYIIGEIMGSYGDFNSLDVERTLNFGWIAFGGIILNILLYFGALVCSHLAAFGTLYELKVNFASHLAKLPLGFHLTIGSGKMRKIMDENIEKIEGFIAHQLPDIVAAFVAPIVMLIILLGVDWRFGLAALVGIVIAFMLEFKAYGNEGAKAMMKNYQMSLEDMNNASVEYIRGISVVKAFKQTVYSFRRLHETIKRYTSFVIPYTLSWENYMSGFTTIVNNIYLFLIPVGILIGSKTNDYESFAITFIFYLIFVPSISSVMMKIMYVSSNGMQIIGGVERMDGILNKEVLEDKDSLEKPKDYSISFNKVSFSYDEDSETSALKDLSFKAIQGQVTAIVGPSGGGKSTIAHLIPRFYDVTEGNIEIGGVDIRNISLSHLMDMVSFVFQDVFLFKQSIMDNIRIGNQHASDKEVIEAAKAAQCHEFIMKLPNGYNTVVGTKGVHLSGGERQRIVIARAIVKNAPIIVLDEATAFSDPENEYLIQKAFEKLIQNKTVIIIAHRLSTIRSANRILVMQKGILVEEGTHEKLIREKGKYHDMWEMYTKSLDWKIGTKEGVEVNA